MELTSHEHQQLILMTGSKKAWREYLGLSAAEANRLWKDLGLSTSTNWLRDRSRTEQLELLAEHGSYAALGKYLGMSPAAAKTIIQGAAPDEEEDPYDEEDWEEMFERYKSVRFVARMAGYTEAGVRRALGKLGLDPSYLIDYAAGGHATNKGRRAELEFAALRGNLIMKDMNREEGSQAEFDFLDGGLGRVNVKSSRRHRYKAQSRKDNRYFWKISTRGRDKADYFVALCYTPDYETLSGVAIIPTHQIPEDAKSFRLTSEDLFPPDHLVPTKT